MDSGSVSSVQPHPFSTLSVPLRIARSHGRMHLFFFFFLLKKTRKIKNSWAVKTADAQASAVASFVTRYPLTPVDPFSSSYCYFVSSAQTLAIVSGLIRKQTAEFLFAGMRALVWVSREKRCGIYVAVSAPRFCEGRYLVAIWPLWTLQQVNRAESGASDAR